MGTRTYTRRGVGGVRITNQGRARVAELTQIRASLVDQARALIDNRRLDRPDANTLAEINRIGEKIKANDTLMNRIESIVTVDGQPAERRWQMSTPGLPDPDARGRFGWTSVVNSPEREQYRQEIIADYLSKGSTEPRGENGRPMLIMMMGGPASGKTTFRKETYGSDEGFVVVDADDVKERLPEYRLAVANSDRLAAARAHAESSDIGARIYDEAFRRGMNIIMDGTGRSAIDYENMIAEAQRAGYDVRLMMPHIDASEAKKRVHARAERSGRFVPDFIVDEAYESIPYNFFRLARQADQAILFDGITRKKIADVVRDEDGRVTENLTPEGVGFKRRYDR